MKKLGFRALLPVFFVFLLSITSCSKEPEEIESSEKSSLNQDDIALITSLGYNMDSIRGFEHGYRVGNGHLISKQRLDEIRKEPLTKIYYGKNYGFLFPEYQTINMNLTPIRGHRTEKSVLAAMQAWNDIPNCRIKFQEGTADAIRVEFFEETEYGGVYLVEIEHPMNGKHGYLIRYNIRSAVIPNAGSDEEKYEFMYILGRMVGFEDIVPGREPGANAIWIQGTATAYNDPHTIMITDLYAHLYYPRIGFTDQDIKAFQLVYPENIPRPTITAEISADKMQLGQYYEISARYDHVACIEPVLNWTWEEIHNSRSFSVLQLSDNKVRARFDKPGTYQFTVKVTNFGKEPVTQTLTVDLMRFADTKPTITITPTDSVELGKHYTVSASYNHPSCPNPVFAFSAKDALYGNSIQITPLDNGKVDLMINNPGQFRITATVTNATPQISASLELKPVYRKYDKIYLKHETKIADSFEVIGRGTVYIIGNSLSFYLDGNLTQPVFLNQNLTVRIKLMQSKTVSGKTQTIVAKDEIVTLKVFGASYRLQTTNTSGFSGGPNQWLEIEYISLSD